MRVMGVPNIPYSDASLFKLRRVNLHPSVTSERIRALLVGKKQNQVRLLVSGHE